MSGIRHLVAATLAATVALSLFAVTNRALAQEFRSEQRDPAQPGLLFYLSGEHGFRADVAANSKPDPNFLNDVKILPNGAKGNYLQCGNNQLLSYWAPGNIYSQRGTLSFFWRSRIPVDETEFPVFRVGYGDHSSWDMVWLRIDYNGHGFDAFVTDVNLGRTRVSVPLKPFPGPNEWIHLALAWDETSGIRFYINGRLAATAKATGQFDTALDQFGPHSRVIAPDGVEQSYNYDRGGDLDELRIYDRALSDENIATLAKNETPSDLPSIPEDTKLDARQQDWWHRYGWNHMDDPPRELPAPDTVVRKVQINDVYDLKRWQWKAADGIRETTWPGVYNRSTLPNRYDYFQLPDWDTYAMSGKSAQFYMPNELWNHIEIEGGAWGKLDLLTPGNGDPNAVADPDQHDPSPQLVKHLFDRPEGQERTTHDLDEPVTGQRVRFTNVKQEWPIGEFAAYYVHPGKEPEGILTLSYSISSRASPDNPSLAELVTYINDRYPVEERNYAQALPGALAGDPRSTLRRSSTAREDAAATSANANALPVVQVLIPADFRGLTFAEGHGATFSWENLHAGLDGIALDIPPMHLKPTHGGFIPMNVQIKDPVWPMRDMLDFSFSVKPDTAYTLWLDTRDRILPNGKSLWVSIASASPEFNAHALEGAHLRLIFKKYEDALPEHIADRLTMVRDNYANMTEESVNSRRLNLFNRFDADITDLLRVDPTNDLARKYWNQINHEQVPSTYKPPAAPAGVPEWAWLQTRDLHEEKSLIEWYVDNRQISDGEFGGGLSDDTDFLNWWPGLAAMGVDPEKLRISLERALNSTFANDMWENGLARAQYDELHSYEDGINTLGQAMLIDYGSPRQIERAMATAKRLEWLTAYNSAGQRQIQSSYYSGTKMATGGVWGWAKDRSYMVLFPALLLVDYNGTPETKKMITEVADGFLAHRHADADGRMRMHYTVNFHTNEDLPTAGMTPWFVLWGAYKFTGDKKYLVPFEDDPVASLRTVNADVLDELHVRDTWGPKLLASTPAASRSDSGSGTEQTWPLHWQLSGDTKYLDKVYTSQLEAAADKEFINREGSLWIDRVYYNNGELQRGRLGGVELMRNYDFPGNAVSWRFPEGSDAEKIGILVPIGAPDHIKLLAYNLGDQPLTAKMIGGEIEPGQWEMTSGTQATENSSVTGTTTRTVAFERSRDVEVTFAPHTTTVIEMTLKTPGVPYWSRFDLGLDREDVVVKGDVMRVTVHSLGGIDAPAGEVVVRDKAGKVIARANTPALKAPIDLVPKTATVSLKLPAHAEINGATVSVETKATTPETTMLNNSVVYEPVDPTELSVTHIP
jgi:hypothetical protein